MRLKLLAIVTEEIKKILIHSSSCELIFQRSWQQVEPASLSEFDWVIVSAALVEDSADPIALWSVASTIRYFGVSAIFVDVPFQATNALFRAYPQIKFISYNDDGNQFFLQLRTCAPQLFYDNPRFRNSTISASANAHRFEVQPGSASRLGPAASISGSRSYSSSELKIPQPTAVTGSFELISSIPFGMKKSSSSLAGESGGACSLSQVPKATPVSDSTEAKDCLDLIADISSISGISEISSIPDALEVAIDGDSDGDKNAPVASQNQNTAQNSSRGKTHSNVCTITRSIKDVAFGAIEFGNIINVLQTIHHLSLTGMLEVRNDTRYVRIEFRHGLPYVTSSPSVVLSALGWTSGEFNFDTTKMLSRNAQPIDLRLLFANAAHEQLALNPLLQALEKKFNCYVVLTNIFDPANHTENAGAWWKLCDGNTRFSEIMMRSEVAMDVISRDIFLAWLCDEIGFLKTPSVTKIRIEYVKDGVQTKSDSNDRDGAKEEKAPTAHEIQVQMIRKQLSDLRDSFAVQSGYSLLGVQRGCGLRALDNAYYAWINQYHADRFVRYNDAECVKLANELLMLMNSSYAKLSKIERANGDKPVRQSSESPIDVSPRIGAGRARISTLSSSSESSRSRLKAVSNELKAIQSNEMKNRQEEAANRNPIRPASIQYSNPVSTKNEQSSAQFVRMSDILAQREAAKQLRNESSNLTRENSTQGASSLKNATRKSAQFNENAAPDQLFSTAQKKLKLGLNQDALEAIEAALRAEPDNEIFHVYRDYTRFLVDPSTRDEALRYVESIAHDLRDRAKLDTSLRGELFAPYYFLGKLYIAAENYEKANDAMLFAERLDSSDIDTQRSLRYIAMQMEKRQVTENKGFFARLKDKLTT